MELRLRCGVQLRYYSGNVSDHREHPRGPETQTARSRPRLADLTAAFGLLTALPVGRPDPHGEMFARATLWFPIVGLVMGALLSALDQLVTSQLPPWVAATLLVVTWECVGSVIPLRRTVSANPGTVKWSTAIAIVGLLTAKIVGLALQPATRSAALLFAPTLGRWTMVVLATGARDAGAPARKFNPGITFREFAVTSVFTFAVCFGVAEFAGILLIVCAAGFTLLMRLVLHRWFDGVSLVTLWLGCEAVEATVVLLLAVAAGG